MKNVSIFLVFASLLVFGGCSSSEERNYIAVTIEPQRYFAEKIAGDKFMVHTVVPAGQSPETYDPTPQQVVRISKSRAYLQIGHIGFEQAWMSHIRDNNPQIQVFDLSEGFALIMDSTDSDEGGLHSHHHPGGMDPHIWSSISGARAIVGNILKAFVTLDKDNEPYYRQNYDNLMAEIDETERIIQQKLSPLTNRIFIIYHPSLTYFANEFDLRQLCIETDGKEPSTAQLKELVDISKEYHVHVVFVQQEFDRKNAERIAKETNCRLVRINPQNYYWSDELISIANALADE